MNSNREDYLKVIYENGGLKHPVSNKIICEKLGVAPGSVSEMLSKLHKLGLVESVSRKGVMLTSEGLSICFKLIRTHRLWEVFLMRHLHYSWREAHEEAHLLEHIATDKMIDRLDLFLNFPDVCPHGEHIPRTKELLNLETELETLDKLEVDEVAVISKIDEEGELLDYLEEVGLKIGEKIIVKSKKHYEGGMVFLQNNKMIDISHKAATHIFIERI